MPDFDTKEVITDIFTFFKAQHEAEENGKQEFVCPLCGGHAHWGRAYNNHLHTGCRDFGFVCME